MVTPRGFGPIRQLGYLTDDLDGSVQAWMRDLGVGPFTIFRGVAMDGTFRGRPTRIEMDVALSFRGDVQVELIQQKGQKGMAPSPYRHRYEAGILGLHHVAYLTEDVEGDLRRVGEAGMTVVCTLGDAGSGRYIYFESPRLPEVYCELLEFTPAFRSLWEPLQEAARVWDGNPDSITELQFSGPVA